MTILHVQTTPPVRPRRRARTASVLVGALVGAVLCLGSSLVAFSGGGRTELPDNQLDIAATTPSSSPTTTTSVTAELSTTSTSPETTAVATSTKAEQTPVEKPKPPVKVPPPPTGSLVGYDTAQNSQAAVDEALGRARAEGKAVLLDFGANWCGVCKRVDGTFGTPSVSAALASYEVVKVDIGSSVKANMALLKQYDNSGSYKMPVLIVVHPDNGVQVNTNRTGLPETDEAGVSNFLRQWAL